MTSTGCHLKLNGSMPAGQVQQLIIHFWLNTHSSMRKLKGKLIKLARRNLIREDCMICMITYGNGCRTSGMILMKVLQMIVVLGKMEKAHIESAMMAAGASLPSQGGRQLTTETFQTAATVT